MTKNAGNRMLATFNTAEALDTQIASIIGFYYPQCIAHDQGGFYQYFDADGAVIKTNQQSQLTESVTTKDMADVSVWAHVSSSKATVFVGMPEKHVHDRPKRAAGRSQPCCSSLALE